MFVEILAPIGRSIDNISRQERTASALEEKNYRSAVIHRENLQHIKEMERIANERLEQTKIRNAQRAEIERETADRKQAELRDRQQRTANQTRDSLTKAMNAVTNRDYKESMSSTARERVELAKSKEARIAKEHEERKGNK